VAAEPIRRGVRALIDEPSYREQARGVAEEIARMPDPAEVVGLLEAIAGR